MTTKLVFTPLCLLFWSAPARGQIGGTQIPRPQQRLEEYSIRGKVITGSGHEGDRIEVRLERSTMQVMQTAYTDAVGNFEFRNLGAGTYWITINSEGYEPVRQQTEVYPGMTTSSTSIFLSRSRSERPRLTGLDAADPNVIDVNQMKENFPKKAVQAFERAMEEKKKGQSARAVKLLEEAIGIAPAFYQAHRELGALYQAEKRYGDAEKEFRRARELNMKAAEPLTSLGSLFIAEAEARKSEGEDVAGKLLDEALDALEQAVKINPRSAMAYYYLGTANYRSEFYEEAEAAFTKALQLDPSLTSVRLMLANIYLKERRWREVAEMLDLYLRENPNAKDRASVEEMREKVQRGLEAANDK